MALESWTVVTTLTQKDFLMQKWRIVGSQITSIYMEWLFLCKLFWAPWIKSYFEGSSFVGKSSKLTHSMLFLFSSFDCNSIVDDSSSLSLDEAGVSIHAGHAAAVDAGLDVDAPGKVNTKFKCVWSHEKINILGTKQCSILNKTWHLSIFDWFIHKGRLLICQINL